MGFLDEILGKEALRKLQNDLAQSAEALSMAKSELHSLRVEKHTVDEGLAASIANATEKEREFNDSQKLLESSRLKNSRLEAEVAGLHGAATEASLKSSAIIAELRGAVSGLTRELSAARVAQSEIQSNMEQMREAYSEKDRTYQEREKRLSEKSEKLRNERQLFQLELADLSSREHHWTRKVEPRLKEYEAYSTLDAKEKGLARLQSDLAEHQRNLDVREADMARRNCDDESLRARESKVSAWNQSLSERQGVLSKQAEDLRGQESGLDARRSELERWSIELQAFQERVNQLDAETESLSIRQRRNEAKETERALSHKARLAEVRSENISLNKLRKEINQRESDVEAREITVKREEYRAANIKAANVKLKEEMEELSAEADSLRKDKRRAVGALSELERKYQELQSSNSRAVERNKTLRLANKVTSSLSHPKILEWLFQEADPRATRIAKGWMGTTGHAPWDLHLMEGVLDEVGYEFYEMPDADLQHLIVGRKDWSKIDLLAQIESRDGCELRIYSQEMFFAMLVTGRDPFDAEDEELLEAFAEDHPALQFLKSLPQPWPSVTSEESEEIMEVDGGEFGVTESPLHLMGYKVGESSGLTTLERRRILSKCFKATDLDFSDDSDDAYKRKWGRGDGPQRLYRMAAHIKSLADGRVGKDPRKPQARRHWVSDLKWLKDKYYESTKNRFSWPGT